MKFQFLKHFFFFIFTSVFLLSGCQSQKPAFGYTAVTPANTTASADHSAKPETVQANDQPVKMVAETAPKLLYDSTKVSFKIKQKTLVKSYKDSDDDDDDDEKISVSKTESIEKYRSHEQEEKLEKWFSGGFLASGTILLLISLTLVIIGSGPAGLLAIIGGALFLTGFILTLMELLGD